MHLNFDALEQIAGSVAARSRTPALAVAVLSLDQPDYVAGFGMANLEEGAACTPETGFAIASVTKTYTAALALAVQSEGLLSLDEPLTRHIPWFQPRNAGTAFQPTLRDALSHRAGIAGYEVLWYQTSWTRQEILARFSQAAPLAPPNSGFAYSNLMVTAAGEAAAQAAGMTYEEALRDKVLLPCGDLAASFDPGGVPAPALPYQQLNSGELKRLRTVSTQKAGPALGLTTSVAGLALWVKFLLKGGGAALPPEAIAEMWRPHSEIRRDDDRRIYNLYGRSERLHYGLGWFLSDHNGVKTVGHTGTLPGFRSHITLLPDEGIGVVALANLNQTLAPEIFTYSVLDLVVPGAQVEWFTHFEQVSQERQKWQAEAERAEAADLPPCTSLADQAICGVYGDPVFGDVVVWQPGGRLMLRWANYEWSLELSADGRYHLNGIDCPLMGDGHTVSFLALQDGTPRRLRFLGHEMLRVDRAVPLEVPQPALLCA